MANHRLFVAMGGNQGDVLESFASCLEALENNNLKMTQVSSAYRTPALVPAGTNGSVPNYWNVVVEFATDLEPLQLLELLQEQETQAGRVRVQRWASRPLDLDLLLYDDAQIRLERLTIPHPELHRRAFVLVPFCEIAGEVQVPGTQKTVATLLAQLPRVDGDVLERREAWLSFSGNSLAPSS